MGLSNLSKGILLASALILSPICAKAQIGDMHHSTALESGRVLKPSGGTLMYLTGYNSKGSAQYIEVFDSAIVPPAVAAEVSTITFGSLTTTLAANTFFTVSDAQGKHYAWFNIGGSGTDPAPAGYVAPSVTVTVSSGSTSSQIATVVASDLATLSVSAAAMGSAVTITDSAVGPRADLTAGSVPGATVTVSTQGVTAAVPVLTQTVAATANFKVELPAFGIEFANGVAVSNSTTSATLSAGSADCRFIGVTQ